MSGETSGSAVVSWSRPLRPNGVISGYRLYFLLDNTTEVATLQSRETEVSHTLTSLRPASTYQVWVKAYTPQHEGQPSPHLALTTEPARPAVPRAVRLACMEPKGLRVAWEGGAEVYMVQVGDQRREVEGREVSLANLSLGEEYEARVRGGVASVHRGGEVRWGAWSPGARLLL